MRPQDVETSTRGRIDGHGVIVQWFDSVASGAERAAAVEDVAS